MIENLLLDEDAIAEVAEPYTSLGLAKAEQVRESLDAIATDLVEREISLRLQRRLPTTTLRPAPADNESPQANVQPQIDTFLQQLASVDINALRAEAKAEVEEVVRTGNQLERFHGKAILRTFYDVHRFSSFGLGWNAFITEVARYAAGSPRIQRLAGAALEKIRLYFPPGLDELLGESPAGPLREHLTARCVQERQLWEIGTPSNDGREGLRQELMQYARSLSSTSPGLTSRLLDAVSGIGTTS